MATATSDRKSAFTVSNALAAVVVVVAVLWLMPVVWVLAMSFKPNSELMRSTAGFLPIPFTLDNYAGLLSLSATPNWLFNSLIVAVSMTLLTLALASTAGYAFARLEFPGRRILFVFVLAGLMVPEQAVFIPLHALFSSWGYHNTHTALIVPRLAVPMGVFLMTQFFRAVPRDIEEAAELDNAGRLTIFRKIMLPLSYPALTTLGLFTFLYAWNDFLWPLVSATDKEMYTITVGLASIQGNFAETEGLGSVMAAAVFASAPVVLLYLVFQKYIVSGVSMGSSK
ncbi:permease [Rhizobium sp. Leaf384]|uniref:carbohydrate ABC transporter permease n=1 Tax=Rhizobium sp. Leaf384 TaxID=1736358 RepID=UPI0007145CCE|nr:carbohydrate ABC transporter permease [Rhizobium sp. Leaf384]KQS78837.1 permease [Rhizobium sp. Leaf384]